MLLFLFLLFTLVPLTEFYLLVYLADQTNWLFAIGLILLTGMLGAALARQQGSQVWNRIHQELAKGQMPGEALTDGFMILAAGLVLITPGIMTDLLGFALLIPPVRKVLKVVVIKYFKRRVVMRNQRTANSWGASTFYSHSTGTHSSTTTYNEDEVIDVEFRHVKKEEPKLNSNS